MSILEMVQHMADFYQCDPSIISRISTDCLNQKLKTSQNRFYHR